MNRVTIAGALRRAADVATEVGRWAELLRQAADLVTKEKAR